MTTKRIIECDACTKQADLEKLEKPWFHVSAIVADEEMAQRIVEQVDPDAYERGDLSSVLDYGDLCSLACVANWASAQSGLRELDVETGS